MTRTERLASAFIGRRIMTKRLALGLTAQEMGARVGLHPKTYRRCELAQRPVTLPLLLKCQFTLGQDIKSLWFPDLEGIQMVDDEALRIQLALWERQERPVTLEQIIEVCADAFGVPSGAVTGGLGHAKVRQARTACAIVVASRPHLRLSDLAPLVGRSRRTLWHIRKQALQADEQLLQRVEEIQREVDSL